MKSLILTTIVLLSMVACTKNQDDFAKNNSSLKSAFVNPYEFVGEQHNAIINNLLQTYSADDLSEKAVTGDSKFYEMFFSAEYAVTKTNLNLEMAELQSIAQFYQDGNLPVLFEQVSNPVVTEIYREILEVVTKTESLVHMVEELKQIELKIANYSMTEMERTGLYIGTAIGRHSGNLWSSEYQGKVDWRRICRIAIADLCAGVEGFISSGGDVAVAVGIGALASAGAAL